MKYDPSEVLAVLQEFIADIETVGKEQVAEEWPDLMITYNKAKIALRQGGTK